MSDVVAYGESIIGKLQGVAFEVFALDDDLRDLVLYRLQCVSEASKNLLEMDQAVMMRHPEIPWRSVRDIGNRLRHDYANIDAELVPSGDLERLVAAAKAELKRSDD